MTNSLELNGMNINIEDYRKIPDKICRDQMWYQYEALSAGVLSIAAIISGYPLILILVGGVLIDGARHAVKVENLKRQYKKGVRVSSRNM